MRKHLRYLSYVVRHKWFVFVAGLKTGALLWRLVIHDWSKFLPSEWFAYAAKFYGPAPDEIKAREYERRGAVASGQSFELWKSNPDAWDAVRRAVDDPFNRAWLLHQNRHPHHWQFWLLAEDNPNRRGMWALTSPDGIGGYIDLTDYASDSEGRVRIHLPEVGLHAKDRVEADRQYAIYARLLRTANRTTPLPMPEKFVREMVADWMGAGRAITGRWEVAEWYAKNRENIVLHPESRRLTESLIAAQGTSVSTQREKPSVNPLSSPSVLEGETEA